MRIQDGVGVFVKVVLNGRVAVSGTFNGQLNYIFF